VHENRISEINLFTICQTIDDAIDKGTIYGFEESSRRTRNYVKQTVLKTVMIELNQINLEK
jgi:hypothetical protein